MAILKIKDTEGNVIDIPGIKGKDGYTPVKGVDYYTEEDKAEIVKLVIESLGGNPVFGYVDENSNVILSGNLADGTYTIKYENEDGSTVDIGDLILGEEVHCTITNNLTNCTSNNSATQVTLNCSYSAALTADSGYILSSVTVMMGDADITSSAYSDGVITIASVTGNVVITATAVKEAAVTYTVTNNLTNCTTSNSATVVEEGTEYTATITANEGCELSDVSATMGGTAVTVTDGVINIASVTGDIIITAVATETVEEITNWIANSQNADGTLFVGTNGEAGYKTNTRLGTSDGGERTQSGIECTGYIPVTIDDTLYFKNVVITSASTETTCFYDSTYTSIGGLSTYAVFGTMDGSVTAIKIDDVASGPPANNPNKIAYVRISAAAIDSNSVITKNQPIE